MATISRPRILLYCDRRGWAYHTTAVQLKHHLRDRYDFDICFAEDKPAFDETAYDLIYVFWWAERWHLAHISQQNKIIKEISSHRWQHQEEFGRLAADEAAQRWMNDAQSLVATSRRLQNEFEHAGKPVYRYPLGIDPQLFFLAERAKDSLSVGWAGNPADPAKRLREILLPACGDQFKLKLADGNTAWEEMPSFYRSIDVIAISSVGEGTPLPLLEAMACGCFPISTDVGVAPEVIEHGKNGLIVEPTVEAFANALDWCNNHLDDVRRAGAENAALIRSSRTWWHSAQQFSEILDHIMAQPKDDRANPEDSAPLPANTGYERHFERINPAGFSDAAYANSTPHLRQEIEALLPESREAKILEIGTGHGHFLKFIAHKGYKRIFGIDICAPMLREVQKTLAPYLERLEVADVLEYLPQHKGFFDCIVMLDVIEHFSLDEARYLLKTAANALTPGGRLILRTPNMANLLGGYSLYMDLTHRHGYTEWSLIHLLEQSSLPDAQLYVPTRFCSPKQKWMALANAFIHRCLYRLNGRAEPRWYGKNIVVFADKPPTDS